MRCFAALCLVAVLACPGPVAARETCDAAGVDADAVSAAHAAIDSACPCDTATSPAAYRRCAKGTLRAMLADLSLPRECRRQAQRYAAESTCGRIGAVVCCRADYSGSTYHTVERDAGDCVDGQRFDACISEWQSVVTGCDARGCIPPCETVPELCGNLVIDAGETCEPPGVGSCARDCLAAPCTAAGPGEIEVACVEGPTSVGSAGNATGYLLAWSGPHRRQGEILTRRFDADGVATDATLSVASSDLSCVARSSDPSVGSDGNGFYVAWYASDELEEFPGLMGQLIRGRRYGATAGADATDDLFSHIPVGSCQWTISGPIVASGAGASRFAVGWQSRLNCGGGVIEPQGVLLDFASAPQRTEVPISYPPPLIFPATVARGPAGVASLAGASLWAWHAVSGSPGSPPTSFIGAAWSDGNATGSRFTLTASQAVSYETHPAVAAGATNFLVVWSQIASDGEPTLKEIRGIRVSRADGRLDVDGGVLLATVPSGISSGPVAAFDGSRWLVAWTQAAGSGQELRAVAVNTDGSVVDTAPRLVADNVAATEPAVASTGDGRVLVAFTRSQDTHTAVRATLVVP